MPIDITSEISVNYGFYQKEHKSKKGAFVFSKTITRKSKGLFYHYPYIFFSIEELKTI